MATNVDRFIRDRETSWTELDRLIAQAKRRPEKLGAERVLRLGELYRSAAADLATARRSLKGDPVVSRLESLVGRGRNLVYDTEARRDGVVAFFTTTYWQRIRSRPGLLAIAAALLFVPSVLAAFWAVHDPGAALGVVPDMFRGIDDGSRTTGSAGLSSGSAAAFASSIMTNNIKVTFMAFAGGITFGVATVGVLIFNGLLLGAVGGLSLHNGYGESFVTLVVAHGVLELSCIVVAGAAGLRLASALVSPGRRKRSVALASNAREAVELVLGTAPWLVVAGVIEAFVTPGGYGLLVNSVVGLAVGGFYWALVVVRGRPSRAVTAALEPSG
ncbi:MAG: stage II sporulation protein M [Actinobacteria bacterium]|nr:stage II sporulation protein M [Actinomycetota bacterium]